MKTSSVRLGFYKNTFQYYVAKGNHWIDTVNPFMLTLKKKRRFMRTSNKITKLNQEFQMEWWSRSYLYSRVARSLESLLESEIG
jgi:hypothetical protein